VSLKNREKFIALFQIRRGIGKFSKLRSHGLEIEDTPKPREESGKTLGRETERKLKRETRRCKSLGRNLTFTESLPNIAGLGNVRQCCNFTKAPLKMPSLVTLTSRFSSKIKLLVV
jgi:hypothetical protein